MKFYDTHMHSHLSFDCDEQAVNYISKLTETMIFTDHLDLENPVSAGADDIPDFNKQIEWQRTFKEAFGVELLLGVEIGYVASQKERLTRIVEAYDFDVKLLSVHQNGRYDYMDRDTPDNADTMINGYLDQLIDALEQMHGCQIMSHFDYGFRVHQLTAADLAPYEPKLMQIFALCVQKGLAFELNSKSLGKYQNADLYEWAIPRYQSLGGTLFSLGSDAHRVSEHFANFDQSIALLERHGVEAVAQFKQQQCALYPLERLKMELYRNSFNLDELGSSK